MCFSSPKVITQPTGPTDSELQASADAQVAADGKLREEQERRAKRKRDDITVALDSKAINKGGGGGAAAEYSKPDNKQARQRAMRSEVVRVVVQ